MEKREAREQRWTVKQLDIKCVYFSQNVNEWMRVKRTNKQQMEIMQAVESKKIITLSWCMTACIFFQGFPRHAFEHRL